MQDNHDTDMLLEEMRQFRLEQESVRAIVGQIGGTGDKKKESFFNGLFIFSLIALFCWDVCRHVFKIDWVPPLISIEIGLLLVSCKIMYMMHKQAKVEHFQFWILNSLEFRLNDVAKKISKIEKVVISNLEKKD